MDPETITAKVSITDLNVLLRERKALYQKALAFQDEHKAEDGSLSAEDHGTFQKMLDDVNRMSDRADEMRSQLQVQDAMAERTLRDQEVDKDTPAAKYKAAWLRYIRNGAAELDADDRKILSTRSADIKAALGVGSGAVGAYTVPEDFYGRVVEVMKAYGGMRRAGVELITTRSGADLPIPTGDDTANVGEIVAENVATGAASDPTFGQVILKAYTYSSKIVKVHASLLQDEDVGLEVLLARWLGIRIARIQNTHFTTGDDNGKPDGVTVSAQDSTVQFAAAAAPTYDELVDLQHSVDPAYREQGRFMMHDTGLAAMKKIKNATTGEPLWLPAVSAREPDTILGSQYTVNQSMASFTDAAAKVVLFGDFSQYFVRDVTGGAMARLVERYAEYFQIGFMLFVRADGGLITPSAIKYALSKA
jgi:HK97 family phage major capsid protein